MDVLWRENLSHMKSLLPALIALLFYVLASRGLRHIGRTRWLSATMEGRVRVLLRWVGMGFVGLLSLQALGLVEHAWAIITATAAAIAVGFVAHWSILSNWLSAFLILFYQRFNIGDDVELLEAFDKLSGMRGKVTDVNLFYTEIEESGAEGGPYSLQIPNNLMFQKVVRVIQKKNSRRAHKNGTAKEVGM